MTALYRQAGSVFDFPFSTKDQWGRLADVTTQGSLVLFLDDVSQGVVPATAIEFTHEGTGLYAARVDAANAELLAQLDEAGFADGRLVTAAMTEIVSDEVEHLGDYLPRTYIVGVAPGSSGNGSKIVTLTVQDADAIPILGVRVTVYDANGRFAGTGVSAADGTIRLHLMLGVYDLSSPSFPGAWQLADPMQSIEVTTDGLNLFDVEFVAMPITWPDVAKAAGWAVLIDEKGKPIAGASVFVRAIRPPASGVNSEGVLPPSGTWEEVSDAEGRVLFGPPEVDPTEEELQHGMLQGWAYQIWGADFGDSESERAIVNVPIDPPGGAFSLRAFIRNEGAA